MNQVLEQNVTWLTIYCTFALSLFQVQGNNCLCTFLLIHTHCVGALIWSVKFLCFLILLPRIRKTHVKCVGIICCKSVFIKIICLLYKIFTFIIKSQLTNRWYDIVWNGEQNALTTIISLIKLTQKLIDWYF